MRLFGKIDGVINRFDRAMRMTPRFDLRFTQVVVVWPRPRLIEVVPRMDAAVFCEARIAPRKVTVGPKIDADISVE